MTQPLLPLPTPDAAATDRRAACIALSTALATALATALPSASAHAAGSELSRRLQQRRESGEGIRIELPELADSGHSVPWMVDVQAPAGHRIRQIELLLPDNPQPEVLTLRLPHAPERQRVATRVRLAASQSAWVVVTLDDGSQRLASAPTIVTASACLDDS